MSARSVALEGLRRCRRDSAWSDAVLDSLIRADGLGNVCRVNRYLLNVQTFVLKVAVLDRDVHRCGTERRRVDQTQVGCAGIGGICCRGSVRIAA